MSCSELGSDAARDCYLHQGHHTAHPGGSQRQLRDYQNIAG